MAMDSIQISHLVINWPLLVLARARPQHTSVSSWPPPHSTPLVSFLGTSASLALVPALLASKMARKARPSASLLLFSLGIVLLCFTSGSTVRLAEAQSLAAQKTWCVAKPSADEKVLQANINYACGNVSCSVIQPGGPCYKPDNMVSHASVAMNLYYAANGRHSWNCYFANSAVIVQSDPSYGSCTYY